MTGDDARPTYPDVGATLLGVTPAGYDRIDVRRVIGHGPDTFAAARDGLFAWSPQRAAGIAVTPARVVDGVDVALRLGVGPFALTAPCRVIWMVDEPDRAGFAYGTLPGHPEGGEEAFVLTMAPDGAVTFAVTGFSREATWWARLGAPVTRLVRDAILRRYLDAYRGRHE